MTIVPLIFTSGLASGINAYAVVLLLGLLGRFAGAESVPPALERTDVLVAAALLFLLEAVADKIPYVDSVWDLVHTVIRPIAGATVGVLMASHDPGSLGEVAAGAVGGTTALVTHLVKASLRMAVNTSPEPASNITVSLLEDLSVGGLVTLAIFHPWPAASIAAVLLAAGLLLVWLAVSRIRAFRARRRERRAARAQAHV
ncbi:membrane protein [Streptomyces rubellomurinus subsp. indigoferus]|nr:membrane protein [Streptomyces rubellomurinus subsp. indigoferus]